MYEAEAGTQPSREAAQGGTPADRPATGPVTRRRPAPVAVLALGGFTAALLNTLPVPLLPYFPALLRTSVTDISWTVTVSLLVAAVWTPISGRLGDMYGKRVVLLWCLGLMVVGSVVCAVAASVGVLIVGRALQGFGAGALPLGLSIMRDEVPRERLGSAMAFMSSAVGIGSTVGFPLSAFLSQHTDWHVLFWAVAVLGGCDILLVLARVPASAVRFGGRFDWVGAAGLSVALVCLLLALSEAGTWGWTSGRTLTALTVGALMIAWWLRFELRTPHPLVDLRTSSRPPVLATNIATFFVGFAMFGITLVLPQVLQAPRETGYGAGFSMVETGLCLSVAGMVMMAVSPMSPAVSARWGARTTLAVGGLVLAVGYALGAWLLPHVWWLSVMAVAVGAGLALAFCAMPALIVAGTPESQTTAANGLNTLTRSVGASLCSAVTGTVLAAMSTTTTVDGVLREVPSALGLRVTLLITTAASLAAAAAAMCVPRAGRRPSGPA